jgi:hypothetical protein
MIRGFFAVLSLAIGASAFASDHIDGPVTTQHRVGDLTDLYAFPSPQRPGFLSIILDAYPIPSSTDHFSDKVSYNLILRSAIRTIGKTGFTTADEVTISCSFTTPAVTKNHTILCKGPNDISATNSWGVVPEARPDAMRVFFGMRSDPFFFNAGWAAKASKGILSGPANGDTMDSINVMSIVLEIETAKFFKPLTSVIAIAAESVTQDSPTAPTRRLDRVGRPEITNVSMVQHDSDPELRDLFNSDRPFNVSAENSAKYRERLLKNISFYDNLDKKKDWTDASALADILTDDFLVVDTAKPCTTPSFFEIERSMLKGKDYQTCGGRKPTDDIMDTLFTLYIAGIDGARIRDGVDHPSVAVSDKFPYLAEPNLSIWAKAKAAIARQVLHAGP